MGDAPGRDPRGARSCRSAAALGKWLDEPSGRARRARHRHPDPPASAAVRAQRSARGALVERLPGRPTVTCSTRGHGEGRAREEGLGAHDLRRLSAVYAICPNSAARTPRRTAVNPAPSAQHRLPSTACPAPSAQSRRPSTACPAPPARRVRRGRRDPSCSRPRTHIPRRSHRRRPRVGKGSSARNPPIPLTPGAGRTLLAGVREVREVCERLHPATRGRSAHETFPTPSWSGGHVTPAASAADGTRSSGDVTSPWVESRSWAGRSGLGAGPDRSPD